MKPDANVGSRIKALRAERARATRPGRTRLSYAYISRIEACTRTPSLSTLIELADRAEIGDINRFPAPPLPARRGATTVVAHKTKLMVLERRLRLPE